RARGWLPGRAGDDPLWTSETSACGCLAEHHRQKGMPIAVRIGAQMTTPRFVMDLAFHGSRLIACALAGPAR
ncbi:hypothetical protein, partial [Xanthobacter autotrophicus]|uniref:hypothetical protein n=1 Tax=Xanthobacter autotrophicus TaxID=280 RepID=UPI00372CC708